MKKTTFIFFQLVTFFLLIFSSTYSQEYTLIDFGSPSTMTSGNWTNITTTTNSQTGMVFNLINDAGLATGAILTINDAFNSYNTNGTTSPNTSLPFPAAATQDSFFGNTQAFSGVTEPTGGFVLSNLNPKKYYSFSIFASRIGVTDNREALYTITGATTASSSLNASENTSNTANIFNILPSSSGTITFSATVGPNNTNSNGFFYLGAIKMTTTILPVPITISTPSIAVVYPNGGENWEAGKTPFISWQSQNISNVTLEYSINNGNTWSFIATVPANSQKYNWTVPSIISSHCKIRISSGATSCMSNANFSIISNNSTVYRIVVIGSSTSAGTGLSSVNEAWVWKYREYLTQLDTRYEVVNLALGGFATYNVLPTGTVIPVGVNRTIDTERNITKALSLNPSGIIVNMPTNDSASGYSAIVQFANFNLIRNTALALSVPVWISSPQPRNFGNASQLAIQYEVLNGSTTQFGQYSFDFWTNLATANGDINPFFGAGDGIHLNNTGHQILFERVVAKGIHTTVKNAVDSSLNLETNIKNEGIYIYPNPVLNELNIDYKSDNNLISEISIYDISGKLIYSAQKNQLKNQPFIWNRLNNNGNRVASGAYLLIIKIADKTTTKKILLN